MVPYDITSPMCSLLITYISTLHLHFNLEISVRGQRINEYVQVTVIQYFYCVIISHYKITTVKIPLKYINLNPKTITLKFFVSLYNYWYHNYFNIFHTKYYFLIIKLSKSKILFRFQI